jgi:ribosomal protein L14E/L6E/L27E
VNGLDETTQLGRLVYSRAGRDEGKLFIIIDILDDNYVYVSDGSLRPIEKPKKKKVKHLVFTKEVAEDIKSMLLSGKKVSNAEIKKFLRLHDISKEV